MHGEKGFLLIVMIYKIFIFSEDWVLSKKYFLDEKHCVYVSVGFPTIYRLSVYQLYRFLSTDV